MRQTKLILKLAIDNQKRIIEEWGPTSRKNPQEAASQAAARIRLEVLEAVLQSLEGRHMLLRLYL